MNGDAFGVPWFLLFLTVAAKADSVAEAIDMLTRGTPDHGCIRDVEHAYSKDGGLAVLFGRMRPSSWRSPAPIILVCRS
jgi:hypothetical protein